MKTVRQIEIEEDLRTRHTGLLTFKEVSDELGIKFRASVNKFLEGLPAYCIDGRKRWRIADVAKRLADKEIIA